jgi:hypothetical protein
MFTDEKPYRAMCFPPGAKVLMADGTEQAIETVKAGDAVMSVNGTLQIAVMSTSVLDNRKLLSFADGHRWSEDHPHWTRDASGSEWWWAANAEMWRASIVGPYGLLDNSTMRTGTGFEFAHVDGWKTNVITEIPVPYDTVLFMPITGGAPIIVDGYLVAGGINERIVNYKNIAWDMARTKLTPVTPETRISGAVQPVQLPAPAPFPADWAPPPIPWTLPIAPL